MATLPHKRVSHALILIALSILLLSCGGTRGAVSTTPLKAAAPVIKPFDTLQWTPLNPARGDASPQAANVWGDRGKKGTTGFLVRFVDGFSSPPHIHNVSYRAVVIRGLVHNDDAGAETMWMPPGSFWTQPRGAGHITSARGQENIALVEIDEGPYLVRPLDKAFEVEERPINVDPNNLVWIRTNRLAQPQPTTSKKIASIALLWGDPLEGRGGIFLRLQVGAGATLQSEAPIDAVVIKGTPRIGGTSLSPGSYAGQTQRLGMTCEGPNMCLVYVRGRALRVLH